MTVARRTVLKFAAATAAAPLVPAAARADRRTHGLSVFGDLKYASDFTHFSYVNPEAPKGGRLKFSAPSWAYNQNPQTFNTFNTFILKGDAPPRLELIYDRLMVRALDEPDAIYGLIAQAVEIFDDGNRYRFILRADARFRDGAPLRARDVAWTLNTLKEKGHPQISQTIREMVAAKDVDPLIVDVTFSGKHSRQLPMIVAGLSILSADYYADHDFTKASMERPLGSGPYAVGRFEAGRYIEYDRDPNWWAANIPAVRGHYNFDRIRLEFFRDRVVAFEAFKKGETTFHEEFFSKIWATGYDFPALEQGRVKRRLFRDDRPAGAQGWFINMRRKKFADPRTREALGLAFDFEWSNKNLFFGLYQRTQSFFQNSTMMAEGPPDARERALLEPFRGQVPDAVFADPWRAPQSDGTGRDRRLLGRAARLLEAAGWRRRDGKLVSADGVPLTIEVLANSPNFERIVQPFANNLRRLGIDASFRLVDPSQYQARLNEFDFDMVGRRYALSATPGESIRQYWGSDAAATKGTPNLAGIKSPAIDALIEKIIHAPNRHDMTIAARALDRVLRAGHYWVSNWYKPTHTVAYWDMFGWPADKPRYGFPVEATWWVDRAKAAGIGMAQDG